MNLLHRLLSNSALLPAALALAFGVAASAAPSDQGVVQNRFAAMANGTETSAGEAAFPPDVDTNSYLLSPSDQLDIDLQGQQDMHRTVQILQDGTFNYPVVGAVKAAGLTVKQLTAKLNQGLSERYNKPRITVSMLQTHTRRISVTGTVKAPGQYEYRPGLHLLEVLAACGGPSQASELTQVTLITERGAKSTSIDLVKLLNEGDQSQNVTLAPGDSLLFSPRDPASSMIHVVGQVQRPGDYGVVAGGATVLAVLTQAGGGTGAAALSHTQILRHDGGQVQTIDLHPLKYNLEDSAGKIKLAAGDTLLIPENNNKIYILGEVRSNSVLIIPDGENLTVTQALAEAGGPTNEGDKKQVGVIRHTPTRSGVKRQLIEVNVADLLSKSQNSRPDVILQPGDELIVPTRKHGHSLGEYLGAVSTGAYTALGLRAL